MCSRELVQLLDAAAFRPTVSESDINNYPWLELVRHLSTEATRAVMRLRFGREREEAALQGLCTVRERERELIETMVISHILVDRQSWSEDRATAHEKNIERNDRELQELARLREEFSAMLTE